MTQIPLAQFAYRRANGLLPSIRLENLFFETSPTNLKTGSALLSRPFLDTFVDLTTGPIRGIFWEKDVFSSDALIAAFSTLYRVTQAAAATSIGALGGSALVGFAASPDTVMIATGSTLQSTDGATLTDVTFPDDLNVISVGFINGYFLAVPENSHRIYYTDLVTGEFDPIRFVSAERYADNVLRIIVTSDEIWAMGSASVEVFVPTGLDDDDNPPFQRVEGRLYKKGCSNAATVVVVDNTVIWAGPGEDGSLGVFRGETVPLAIDDEHIAERLGKADAADLRAWVFGTAKHVFYVLAMGAQGTVACDLLTGNKWFDWTSYQRDQWRAHVGKGCWGGLVLAGDDETGQVWQLSNTATSDSGTPVIQVFTAGAPIEERLANFRVALDCAVGQAAISVSPVISLRTSDDQGRTWTDPETQSLGEIGEYDFSVGWNRLGLMVPPARIYEWTVSDPVRLRISGAKVNEAT